LQPALKQHTNSAVDWHNTVDNESWNEVKEKCKVKSDEVRLYLHWCKSRFKIGNDAGFKRDPTALYFPSPLSKRNRNTKFNAECKFPIAEGQAWDEYVQDQSRASREARMEREQALRIAEEAFRSECVAVTRTKNEIAEDVPPTFGQLHEHVAAAMDNTRPPYVDPAGIPIPPKTTAELYKRTDQNSIKLWDTALRKEWDGLCEREVFEHDLTERELHKRGILPNKRIIGIRVIYESKVKNGKFERAKARAVAQGFGFKKGGKEFASVFAAAPRLGKLWYLKLCSRGAMPGYTSDR
jgi:hypothetical protein